MWLLPTRNRILKLKSCLVSMIQANTSLPGLIIIDENDWKDNRAEYEKLERPKDWEFKVTKAVGMGDKIREVWKDVDHCDWVGVLNDDHHVVTPEWDKKLVEKLNGKNFVSANDRWMAPIKATTATAWSMPLLTAVGWPIYPPDMKHLFIDDVWETIGKSAGCWRPCMHVIVEHWHVIRGQAQEDDTHRAVYNQKSWETDKATYELWLKHDAEEIVRKVIAFQNETSFQRYTPNISKGVQSASPASDKPNSVSQSGDNGVPGIGQDVHGQ